MIEEWGPLVMSVVFGLAPLTFLIVAGVYVLWRGSDPAPPEDYPVGDHSHYGKSIHYAKRRKK